jgi:hypothetical protein
VLDPSVLAQSKRLGTWKENTPFKPSTEFRLSAVIEEESQNTRKNAIQYILLHELAHVISIGGKIHPSWNVEPGTLQACRLILSFSYLDPFRGPQCLCIALMARFHSAKMSSITWCATLQKMVGAYEFERPTSSPCMAQRDQGLLGCQLRTPY